jgi:hypothetical protein
MKTRTALLLSVLVFVVWLAWVLAEATATPPPPRILITPSSYSGVSGGSPSGDLGRGVLR